MRRVMSLFLPSWPTDRLARRQPGVTPADGSFVTAITIGNRRLVAAASPAAVASGISPGLPLADAQAYVPGIAVHEADPVGDAEALRRLAEWCGRYSPWTAPDGSDGIVLDITGCAHLRGGEARLAEEIVARVGRLGFTGRAAIADTAGAAWALARFDGERIVVVPPGESRAALAALPVAALHLPAASTVGLERLGLKRIGELYKMPRAALAQRFGVELARRLDEALGAAAPVSPLRPAVARRTRLSFAEPIATAEDLARATAHLVAELCRGLAAEGSGARRLHLACYRVDGLVEQAAIGTARPSRDARHLTRLLAERLAGIDPGLGIEDMVLTAPLAERLDAAQLEMRPSLLSQSRPFPPSPSPPSEGSSLGRGEGKSVAANAVVRGEDSDTAALAALVDRLGNRLGLANLHAVAPYESHLPERAVAILPPLDSRDGPASWPAGAPRPVRLLARPEPIEATALVPDDPPVMFRWRRLAHRIRRADGPERIAEEWWRMPDPARVADPAAIRDYYRVEDESGRRFWLFRAGLYRPGSPASWFLHGVFA